jgi:hypothetical protein
MLPFAHRIDWHPWLVAAAASFAVVGCGPSYVVRGTVTYQGKPVEGARVELSPQTEGGAAVATKTDQEGHFELRKKVTPGDYVVVVSKTRVKYSEPPADAESGPAKAALASLPVSVPLLPGRYGDPTTSPFRCTVPAGEPLQFDLSD